MDAAVVGRFLAETRRAQDLTQAELAGRIGVTDKAVSRWERGVGYPDINTLEPLADALGVTLTELMKCSRDKEKSSDEGIIASIEIAKSQRKKVIRKIIGGGALCVFGVWALLYALKLFMTHTWTFMVSGSDGPTAVFVAGRIGNLPPTVTGIIGAAALVVGIAVIVRANNPDQ